MDKHNFPPVHSKVFQKHCIQPTSQEQLFCFHFLFLIMLFIIGENLIEFSCLLIPKIHCFVKIFLIPWGILLEILPFTSYFYNITIALHVGSLVFNIHSNSLRVYGGRVNNSNKTKKWSMSAQEQTLLLTNCHKLLWRYDC